MKNKYNKHFIAVTFTTILFISVIVSRVTFNEEIKQTYSYNSDVEVKSIQNLISKETKEYIYDDQSNEEKVAYITIDDGPSKYTSQIIDILNKNDVKATFFFIDGNMKKYPQEVNELVEDGHSIGFHTVSHDKEILYSTPQQMLNEFETCKETFKSITGHDSNLIRIPYGSKPNMSQEGMDMLKENDFLVWDWNLDTEDWKGTADNILSNILYYGRNKSKLVILIHEKQQTVDALDNMIRVLKERGYKIMPITEDIEPHNYWNKTMG